MNASPTFPSAPLRPHPAAMPSLPDRHGFAGMFAGVAGGHLLCAGGANFPVKPLRDGGTKVWHAQVYALAPGGSAWQEVGQLPCPNGYGVSASWRDAVVLVGGGDQNGNFRTATLMRYDGQKLAFEALPPLPQAIANACGAMVGDTLYVAGGQETPDAAATVRRCLVIDLAASDRAWREIPWPREAAGRILAVAGADSTGFYLFGGADLSRDASGAVVRHYLNDAWHYHPQTGWRRLANLPRAIAASPGNAMRAPDGSHWIVGGVTPEFLATLAPAAPHPGFPHQLWRYDPTEDRWTESAFAVAGIPARVTAPLVAWQDLHVIPSGEVAPGIRTPTVQAFTFAP